MSLHQEEFADEQLGMITEVRQRDLEAQRTRLSSPPGPWYFTNRSISSTP